MGVGWTKDVDHASAESAEEQVKLGSLAGAGKERRTAALVQSHTCCRGFATRRDGSGGNV